MVPSSMATQTSYAEAEVLRRGAGEVDGKRGSIRFISRNHRLLRASIVALCSLLVASVGQASPFAYVTGENNAKVFVIDTATNTVTTSITVGSGPVSVAVTPNNTRAYVTDQTLGAVSVINTATNTVVATINLGAQPNFVAITPDGARAYVTNGNTGNVSVIDTG